jgi:hypothetical protein
MENIDFKPKQWNEGIENVNSFNELYERIRRSGGIQGSREFYTPDKLINIIEQVRHNHRPPNFITNTFGIRDIVERLLETDAKYLKYTKGSRSKK